MESIPFFLAGVLALGLGGGRLQRHLYRGTLITSPMAWLIVAACGLTGIAFAIEALAEHDDRREAVQKAFPLLLSAFLLGFVALGALAFKERGELITRIVLYFLAAAVWGWIMFPLLVNRVLAFAQTMP